jgi:hypothetical protein
MLNYKNNIILNVDKINVDNINIYDYKIGYEIEYNSDHWYIYNFNDNNIYKKSNKKEYFMLEGLPNPYKDLADNIFNDNMNNYIKNFDKKLKVEIKTKLKSHLFILDDTYKQEELDRIFYSVYHTYINNNIINVGVDFINNITYDLNNNMHWIWFRRNNTYLDKIIIDRATSWIDNNPYLIFNFWTNIKNIDELKEYVKYADPEFIFFSKIKIHYSDDIIKLTKDFITDDNYLYENIINDNINSSSMLFKTDTMRMIVLSKFGGWYSDFNDTICTIPLKYIINKFNNIDLYIGTDVGINNYLIYTEKDNQVVKNITLEIIKESIRLYDNYILNPSSELHNKIIELFNSICDIINTSYIDSIYNTIFQNYNQIINIINNLKNSEDYKILTKANIIIDDNFIVRLLYNIIKNISVSDNLKLNIENEINNIIRIRKIYRKRKIVWKNNTSIIYDKPIETDINIIKEEIKDINFMNNIIIKTFIVKIMHLTNFGIYINKIKNDKTLNINEIPYCSIKEECNFFSTILHYYDGSLSN